MKSLLFILLVAFTLTSCTENSRVKMFGGKAQIDLPPGRKLVNVTWKDADLWYLTKIRQANEPIETYEFQEKSSYGIWQGTYTISEH